MPRLRNLVYHSGTSTLMYSVADLVRAGPSISMPESDGPDPRDVDPVLYGHHASISDGETRYWWFRQTSGRYRFMKDYLR